MIGLVVKSLDKLISEIKKGNSTRLAEVFSNYNKNRAAYNLIKKEQSDRKRKAEEDETKKQKILEIQQKKKFSDEEKMLEKQKKKLEEKTRKEEINKKKEEEKKKKKDNTLEISKYFTQKTQKTSNFEENLIRELPINSKIED